MDYFARSDIFVNIFLALTEHARVFIPQMKCYLNLYRKVIRVSGSGGGGMDGRIAKEINIIL